MPAPVLLARTFLLFFQPDAKIWIRHETDRQKCYGRKNTGRFGVSAIRIQWTTSRTRIRPKSKKKKLKFYFAYPSNPGVSVWAGLGWSVGCMFVIFLRGCASSKLVADL